MKSRRIANTTRLAFGLLTYLHAHAFPLWLSSLTIRGRLDRHRGCSRLLYLAMILLACASVFITAACNSAKPTRYQPMRKQFEDITMEPWHPGLYAGFDPSSPNYENHPASQQRPISRLKYKSSPGKGVSVSVIMCHQNKAQLLDETFESLRRQTMPPKEVLVMDDYSTQGELQSLENKCAGLSGCRVIVHNTLLGLPGCRNHLIQNFAQEDYVLILDSDDLIEHTMIEKGVWFLESHPEVPVFKGYTVGFQDQEYIWVHGWPDPGRFREGNSQTATALIRKSLFLQLGGYDLEYTASMEDYAFWVSMLEQGLVGYQIPEVFDWYRRNDTSAGLYWLNDDMIKGVTDRIRTKNPRFMIEGQVPPVAHIADQTYVPVDIHQFDHIASSFIVDAPKRVLMLVPWFAVGGADLANKQVAEAFVANLGWQVTIVGTQSGHQELMPVFESITPDVFYLPNFIPKQHYLHFILHLIASRNVDIVVMSNSEMAVYMLPVIRQLYKSMPIISIDHMQEMEWRSGGHARQTTIMHPFLDRILVISENLKSWMQSNGVPGAKIDVCYMGPNHNITSMDRTTARNSIRTQYGWDNTTQVLVFAARLEEQKRPLLLVNIASELIAQGHENFVIIVAGEGTLMKPLQDAVADHQIQDKFTFVGRLSNAEVIKLVAGSDIFLQPSKMEGISLAAIESLAVGTAVITTDVGAQRELIKEKGMGYLVPVLPEEETVRQSVAAILDVMQGGFDMYATKTFVERHFTEQRFKACITERVSSTFPGTATDSALALALEIYMTGSSLVVFGA